jgi:hypothetical protein
VPATAWQQSSTTPQWTCGNVAAEQDVAQMGEEARAIAGLHSCGLLRRLTHWYDFSAPNFCNKSTIPVFDSVQASFLKRVYDVGCSLAQIENCLASPEGT